MIVLYDAIAKLLLNLACLWAAASLSVAIKHASGDGPALVIPAISTDLYNGGSKNPCPWSALRARMLRLARAPLVGS